MVKADPKWCLIANMREGTNTFAKGAKVYCAFYARHDDWNLTRVRVLGRSRGGRWVKFYVAWQKLTNWRAKYVHEPHIVGTEDGKDVCDGWSKVRAIEVAAILSRRELRWLCGTSAAESARLDADEMTEARSGEVLAAIAAWGPVPPGVLK